MHLRDRDTSGEVTVWKGSEVKLGLPYQVILNANGRVLVVSFLGGDYQHSGGVKAS